jgi:glycosyltransferase involved in cell wall biosynthesis
MVVERMENSSPKKRVLIFIVAYNAEQTIRNVLERIPPAMAEFDTHILIIDDSSDDRTFEQACEFQTSGFPLTVLVNPVNQGYGGNQKIGFHYAIEANYDYLVLLHGDGQYAPERMPDLVAPLAAGEADFVMGSRMMQRGGALAGGMPLYKFVGNKILTWIQNRLLHARLSEFHSGYRVYSVDALRQLPFDRNTNDFHFDTEIIIQLLRGGYRIQEVPIPTYYGGEICRVNGLKYALNVVRASVISRTQDWGIFYQRKYDVKPPNKLNPLYQAKWGFESPHTLAVSRVAPGSRVVDIGCAAGYMAHALRLKHCEITGIDQFPPDETLDLKEFIQFDLNAGGFPVDTGAFDFILLLDIIEHLRSPEAFVDDLRASRSGTRSGTVIASTGNIAFLFTRMMLGLGYFHYGSRGILDLTHTRLFTFATFTELFEQAGYRVTEVRGVPAPFPLALGNNWLSRLMVKANAMLILISKSLFSYQIFVTAQPLPSLPWLLERAVQATGKRLAGEAWRGHHEMPSQASTVPK